MTVPVFLEGADFGRPRAADMTVRYLGHAGFVVQSGDIRVMIDPWFHSAFLGSWFPRPDNRPILNDSMSSGCDYLFISHVHEDHLDRRFLKMLGKDAVVICPRFRSKSVKRELRALGFTDFLELGHLESATLCDGLTATMILDTSHKEDSALLLESGGVRFLDLNDCHPRLSELPTNIDLLAAQFSGAMWYPNCYDYPPPVMAAKVEQIRNNLLDTLVQICKATGARTYLPCAGPPCFLDPELDVYNDPDSTIFPLWQHMAEQFAGRLPIVDVIEMAPGQSAKPDGPGWEIEGAAVPDPDMDAYRYARRNEWTEPRAVTSESQVTTEELSSYFGALVRKNATLAATLSTDIRISTERSNWDVRLPGGEVREADAGIPCRYRFELPGWVLRQVIEKKASWEEALLSMRVKLHRDPDVFDMALFGLLRYGQQPVQTQQMLLDTKGSDEFIERDGYRFQRYCPHAGEDLVSGTICGTTLECPRHHWAWDLTTGRCISGGTVSISVE